MFMLIYYIHTLDHQGIFHINLVPRPFDLGSGDTQYNSVGQMKPYKHNIGHPILVMSFVKLP